MPSRTLTSLLGAAALLTTSLSYGQTGPTSSGEVASTSISRGALAPDFLSAFGYGYYTYINGITGSMFGGAPGEATAYFTFKTSVATTFPLPQNIDETLVVSSGALYDIYLDQNPKHDWSNPDSFATGQKVATFQRTGFILSGIGFAAFETFNSTLVSSQPFVFNGKTIDFKNLTPGLRTSNMFGRLPFPSGIKDFPVALSFTGHAVATKLPGVTAATAAPKGATAFAPDFALDGTTSVSADSKGLKYQWALAPGSPAAGISRADTATPSVRFTEKGLYELQLTVTDSAGDKAVDSVKVNYVGN